MLFCTFFVWCFWAFVEKDIPPSFMNPIPGIYLLRSLYTCFPLSLLFVYLLISYLHIFGVNNVVATALYFSIIATLCYSITLLLFISIHLSPLKGVCIPRLLNLLILGGTCLIKSKLSVCMYTPNTFSPFSPLYLPYLCYVVS